jgi:hypothetical protein
MRVSRILPVVGLFLVLAGGPALAVDAQEATPVVAPVVGDDVIITDVEGNELGLITIEDVEDDFDGYAEGAEPAEDARYVLVTIAFEATGEEPFEANPSGLVLRDIDGFHWVTYSIAREEDSPPQLQSQTLSPGNRISGVVGFQAPEDAELTHIYYQPEGSRLIELAVLDEEFEPGPALGEEVPYASVEVEGAEGIVTVADAEDPFEDFAEGYEPAEDARFVLLTVAFESTGDQPFDADPYDLLLRDSDGFLWAWSSVPRADDTVPELQSQTLSAGNRVSGVVGFQVPEDAELAQLFWQPESGRLVLLADFRAEADTEEDEAG